MIQAYSPDHDDKYVLSQIKQCFHEKSCEHSSKLEAVGFVSDVLIGKMKAKQEKLMISIYIIIDLWMFNTNFEMFNSSLLFLKVVDFM